MKPTAYALPLDRSIGVYIDDPRPLHQPRTVILIPTDYAGLVRDALARAAGDNWDAEARDALARRAASNRAWGA